jgi:hypothetical protein
MSRRSSLCVLAALPLLSCIVPTPGSKSLSTAATEPAAAACPKMLYAPKGETTPLTVQLSVRFSRAFEFGGYCLALDGAALTMQDATTGNADARRSNELHQYWAGDVEQPGPHVLTVIGWMRGAGAYEGYRFEFKSSHEFVFTDDAPPAIEVSLYEIPGEFRLEMRPAVRWEENAGIARP